MSAYAVLAVAESIDNLSSAIVDAAKILNSDPDSYVDVVYKIRRGDLDDELSDLEEEIRRRRVSVPSQSDINEGGD